MRTHDCKSDTWRGKVATIIALERNWWCEWMLRIAECLPQPKCNQEDEANNERGHDSRVTCWNAGSVYNTNQDWQRACDEQEHAQIVQLTNGRAEWDAQRMSWRVVEEEQAGRRDGLQHRGGIEVGSPVANVVAIPRSHRDDDDGEIYGQVSQDDTNVPPLIRQELWKRESGHLTQSCSKAADCHPSNNLRVRLSGPNYDMSDGANDLAGNQEPSSSQHVRIRSG